MGQPTGHERVVACSGASALCASLNTVVFLTGNFANWDRELYPMTSSPDGSFTLTMRFKPGTRLVYKFIVDGAWKLDPDPNARTESDARGNRNHVRVVPEALPFCTTCRLGDVVLDAGALTPEAFAGAPGGHFGKVFRGSWGGTRVAVKVLASNPGVDAGGAAEAFRAETANMVEVRKLILRARLLDRAGLPLSEACGKCNTAHDLRGYRHLVFVFGVGTEPDLAAVAPGLPHGPAHLIIMEELTGGTVQQFCTASTPPPPLGALLRTAEEMASGLVALAAAHVVHGDLKVRCWCRHRPQRPPPEYYLCGLPCPARQCDVARTWGGGRTDGPWRRPNRTRKLVGDDVLWLGRQR